MPPRVRVSLVSQAAAMESEEDGNGGVKSQLISYEIVDSMIHHLLVKDAKMRSWKLYEELDFKGELNPYKSIQYQYLKMQKEGAFGMLKYDMFYYFEPNYCTPYRRLRIRQYKETGEELVTVAGDDSYPREVGWRVEKDQAYVEFEEKIRNCDKIRSEPRRKLKLQKARRIALKPRFRSLFGEDVTACVDRIIDVENMHKRTDAERDACFYLLNKDVQAKLGPAREELIHELEQKFGLPPLVNYMEELISVVRNFGGFMNKRLLKDPVWVDEMKQKITDHFEVEREKWLEGYIPLVDYLKLKLEWAKEIGVIAKDEKTGQYVDIYTDIFTGDAILSEALQRVDMLHERCAFEKTE